MRRFALSLAVPLIAIAISGCVFRSVETAEPALPPDAPVTHEPGPDDPAGPSEPPFVTPRPGMQNLHPVAWENAVVEDSTVVVSYWSGVEPCYVLDHVEVDYGADVVTITLFEGNEPADEPVACIEIAMEKRVRVDLDEPIGARRLQSGA